MTRMIFVNLPVADVEKSAAFYTALGFQKDARFSQAGQAAAMQWSDAIVVMLLSRDFYKGFVPHKEIADSRQVNEVLLALSLDNREAVDEIVDRAIAAGGTGDIRPAQDLGFMYGRSFEDLDGHVFEPNFMDLDAALAAFGAGAEAQPA